MLVKDLVEELLFYGEEYDIELNVNGEVLDFQVVGNDSLKSIILDSEDKYITIVDAKEYEDLLMHVDALESMTDDLESLVNNLEGEVSGLQEEVVNLSEQLYEGVDQH